MSKNVTAEQIAAAKVVLMAMGMDLDEVIAAAKPAKVDGRNHAARKHNHDARIARRQDPARKGGAGMTKAEKSALYADLKAQYGRVPTKAEWNRACKKARGL